MAVIGEVIGTGVLGSLVSFPIAKLIMGKSVGAFAFIIPFSISTVVGSVIAYFLVMVFEKTKIMKTI
jgi:energy coupling factor transporter S component ThiW